METLADASCLPFLQAAVVTVLFSRGKMKRIVFQFTPYSWVKFEWKPASSLRRWLAVCGIIFVVRTPLWPFCPLAPASVTSAALGMFLELRPGGVPSQSRRAGGCARVSGTGDGFTAGRVVLACCTLLLAVGAMQSGIFGFSAICCSPKHRLWVKVAQISRFYAGTGHVTAGKGCIRGFGLL